MSVLYIDDSYLQEDTGESFFENIVNTIKYYEK